MNNNLFTYSLTVFIGFLAIMNPLVSVSAFLGLVENQSEEEKRKVAKTACIVALIILFIFVIGGKYIFDIFGITIPAFKITGGILVFYVGFEMLSSKKSKINNNPNVEFDSNIAISPLAIPILTGPGTIVTAMNFVTNATYIHVAIVLTIFTLMIILTYYSFILSDLIFKKLGQNLIAVIAKLMGLILAVLGTDMIIQGIKLAFKL